MLSSPPPFSPSTLSRSRPPPPPLENAANPDFNMSFKSAADAAPPLSKPPAEEEEEEEFPAAPNSPLMLALLSKAEDD